VSFEVDFNRARRTQKEVLWQEHPDMFLPEMDEKGQPKKDDKGNLVLKRNAQGEPFLNPNSDKGKIWSEVFNEDPNIGQLKNATTLLQSKMERKLRERGLAMVNDAEKARQSQVKEGQVAPPGVVPPTKVNVTFKSEEEKAHAEGMVKRGLYQNLEEYVANRDTKNTGYFDENRTPNFGKK
jgi:hypothetical protein